MKSIPCWVVYLGVTSLMPGMSQSAQVTSNMELTSQDLQNLGEFIADLTRTLHVSVVSVCFNRLQGVEVERRVVSALARRFVFVSRCHAHVPATSPRYCSAQSLHPPTTSPGAKPNPTPPDSSCWTRQHAEVYLTSPDDLAQTVQQVVQRYKSTGGSVSQVVLGRNLSFTDKVEPGVASWILASYTQATQQAVIQEVFTFRSSSESVVQLLGTWRPTTRLHLVHAPGQGPLNFNGQTIYLASFPYPPYSMEGEECPQSHLFWERDQHYRFDPHCYPRPPPWQLNEVVYVGYLVDIFNALAFKLNFTYKIVLPKDEEQHTFGMGSADNYSGLVGMIVRGEADVVLASLSISKGRFRDIDFSSYVELFAWQIYIRYSAIQFDIGWGTYVLSFDVSIWVGTVGLLAVTTLALWLIHRSKRHVPWDMVSLPDIFFMLFSCIVQQGVPSMPATYLGRVVFWLFCFSCVILYTSYTALLTSYLTVSTKTPPFTTFNAAVASHPTWQIGIMRGTPLLQFLMEAKGGDYAVLSTRLEDHPHLTVSTEEEGVARLLTENYAFLTTNQLMTYMYRKNCSVKQIDINLFPSYGHMGYAKNLPFAGILDMEISRLTDGGVLDRLERRWWGRKIPCEDPEPFTHLDFTHTVTAFLILLIGFILASFFLIIEKVYKKCLRNRKKFFVTPEQPKAPHSKKQQYGATQSANTLPSSARSRILTPLDPLPHFSENEVGNYCKPPHFGK